MVPWHPDREVTLCEGIETWIVGQVLLVKGLDMTTALGERVCCKTGYCRQLPQCKGPSKRR